MSSVENGEGMPEMVQIGGELYDKEEVEEAIRVLDEVKKNSTKLDIDAGSSLQKVFKEIYIKFDDSSKLLTFKDANLILSKIKDFQAKANLGIEDLIEMNPKNFPATHLYFFSTIDLLIRSGFGNSVIQLFSPDFEFPKVIGQGGITKIIYSQNIAKILGRLAAKNNADWVMDRLRNDILDNIQPDQTETHNLVLQLVQSNRSDLFYDFIFDNYGDQGLLALYNTFGKIYKTQTKGDKQSGRAPNTIFNAIVETTRIRFEGYKLFRLLPQQIDIKFLTQQGDEFISIITNLLTYGAYLRVKDRFQLNNLVLEENTAQSLYSLVDVLTTLEHVSNNLNTNNAEFTNAIARERRMLLREGITHIRTRDRSIQLRNPGSNTQVRMRIYDSIHYVTTVDGIDVFQVANSGSLTKILRNISTNEVTFVTYYKKSETYEIIRKLAANGLVEGTIKAGRSYRERFLGATVGDILHNNQLDRSLIDNIQIQMERIKQQLENLGLNHRHPHYNNFNVLFLFEINGQTVKVLSLEKAIELSINLGLDFIPEVYVRDFDLIEEFPRFNNEL